MAEQIELIPFLEKILDRTTQHYKSDFQYDISRLQSAVSEPNAEYRTFYWMARPSGTWLVTERDAFLRGSDGHTIWTHYADEPQGIKAYRIVVTGGSKNAPVGTVRRLNYAEQVRRVEANALPAVRLELTFLSGQVREITPEKYTQEREWLFNEYGMTRYFRYCPESETELAQVLMAEHRCQKGRKPKATNKKTPQHESR